MRSLCGRCSPGPGCRKFSFSAISVYPISLLFCFIFVAISISSGCLPAGSEKKIVPVAQANQEKSSAVKNPKITEAPKVDAAKGAPNPKGTFISGTRYLTMNEIVKSLQLKIVSDDKKGKVIANKGGATVEFNSGKDYILYQTSPVFLTHFTKIQGQEILVSYDDYLKVLVSLLAVNLVKEKVPIVKTILLDPGHGGKDLGAKNLRLNLSEKDLALTFSRLLKVELLKKGYKVLVTRDGDSYVELKTRPQLSKNADFFLSLHLNAAENSQASGVEVYTLRRMKNFSGNHSDVWNLISGYSLLSALEQASGFKNRGIKMAEFAVLKTLSCPGVLVELGFISNDNEAKKLADPVFQKKIIQGIVDGVEKYQKNLSKKR